MTTPFFSVILPTFNRAYIIEETISSVIDQKFENWELIVVDDGSSDNTKDVVQSLEDSRIKYVYQNNAERSVARNNGIKNSNGEYLCFLDSDDKFEPNHLSCLYDYIIAHNHPVELIFTNCYYLSKNKKDKPNLPKLGNNSILYFLENPIIPARTCIHQAILEKHQFNPDIVIVEDTVLWVFIANNYKVSHIEEYTVQYRIHEDNSINIKNNCYLPRLRGLEKLFSNYEIKAKIGPKMARTILSDCYFGIFKHHQFTKNYFQQIRCILESMVRFPDIKLKHKLYLLISTLPNSSNFLSKGKL